MLAHELFNIGQGGRAIDVRLTLSQSVQVWAVDYNNLHTISAFLGEFFSSRSHHRPHADTPRWVPLNGWCFPHRLTPQSAGCRDGFSYRASWLGKARQNVLAHRWWASQYCAGF